MLTVAFRHAEPARRYRETPLLDCGDEGQQIVRFRKHTPLACPLSVHRWISGGEEEARYRGEQPGIDIYKNEDTAYASCAFAVPHHPNAAHLQDDNLVSTPRQRANPLHHRKNLRMNQPRASARPLHPKSQTTP